ncbi:hypothetical protein QBC45DRAFT_485551, partial [Copromyces sp. CBS 386.78]
MIESTAKHGSMLTKLISEYWPNAMVKVFDFFDKNDPLQQVHNGYLCQHAQSIIDQLNHAVKASPGGRADSVPVVFLAHNIGGALAQRVLHLALQHTSSQWIAIWAVAVHIVDYPVAYEQSEWEDYVLRLIGNTKLNLWHLSGILEGFPSALAQINLEFSFISDAFNVHYHNIQQPDLRFLLDVKYGKAKSRGCWGFHEDQTEFIDMLASINEDILNTSWDVFKETREPFWRKPYHELLYQRYIAVPEVALGWLIPNHQLHPILQRSLDHEDSDLKSWRESSKSEALLVTGPPGSGAKHLACWAITTLRPESMADKADMLVLSYDFDCQDTRRNTERSLLASLIQQVVILKPDSGQHIRMHLESFSDLRIPDMPCNLLWSLLKTLLQAVRARRIFLVIHAIDQCLEAAPLQNPPRAVARKLADLSLGCQESYGRHMKILMTTSGLLDLGQDTYTRRIDLGGDGYKDLVQNIVREKVSTVISQAPAWREFEEEILEKLCAKEHTHLQIMLNLKILEQITVPSTKEGIRCWLSKPLPFSSGFLQLEIRDVPSARNILSWVSYAVRPLTIRELSVAVALQNLAIDGLKFRSTSLKSLEAMISSNLTRDIESAVKVLIDIGDDQHVTLAHHTLRKSLESEGTLLWPEQHASIAGQCLLYMSLCSQHNSTSQPAGTDTYNTTSLLAYSQHYWIQHYTLAESPNDDLDQQVLCFLSDEESLALRSWARTYKMTFGNTTPEDILHDKPRPGAWGDRPAENLLRLRVEDPLLLAIQLGFGRIVRMILAKEDFQQQPKRLEKALILSACCLSQTSDIMADLLPHTSSSHDFRTALRSAAAYGNTNCVELLLNYLCASGKDPANHEKSSHYPLILAASGGHKSTVELLMKRGFRCHDTGYHMSEYGVTAVQQAARLGDAETMSVMRELNKEDFNRTQGRSKDLNPLGSACWIGSSSVIDIVLMDEEQRVLRFGPEGGSALNDLSAGMILLCIASTGNLAMFDKFSIVGKYPFSTLCRSYRYDDYPHYFKERALSLGHFLGRIACTEVIKFLVEKEQHTLKGEGDTMKKNERMKAFDDEASGCVKRAIRRMNNDLAIWLSAKINKPVWDEWIESAVSSGNLTLVDYFAKHGTPVSASLTTKNGVMHWVEHLENAVDSKNRVHVARYLANILQGARGSVSQHLEPKTPELASLFIRAARRGNTFCLRELYRELFVPFDLAGAWGTILENAIGVCTPTIINDLFKWKPEGHKPSVSLWERATRRAVAIADDETRLERVRLLLANGILAPNPAGKGRTTPLHIAVDGGWGDGNVVELLLQAGANPNAEAESSETPVHLAAPATWVPVGKLGAGRFRVGVARLPRVKTLLDPWIQNECCEEDPARPMSLRRNNSWKQHKVPRPTSDLPITENLKRPLVDAEMRLPCDKHGRTPLIFAFEEWEYKVVPMLLSAGADPNLQDSGMCTPLYAAMYAASYYSGSKRENFELVKALIDHNADVNLAPGHPFGSPLHFLAHMVPHQDEYFSKTADLFLQKKANINAQDSCGFTPLMSLLARFIDETSPPLTNCLGKSALHYAAFYYETFDVMKMLLEAGANPLARDNLGHTPLYYCLLSEDCELASAWSERVRTLMRAIPAADRQLALSEAILAAVKTGLEERLDMVLSEREEGLDLLLDIPDNSGYLALDIAYSFGKQYETATQKIIALGGKTGSDDQKKSPTRWNENDRSEYLRVSKNGMEVSLVEYRTVTRYPIQFINSVRADHPIPTKGSRFYFEVEVLDNYIGPNAIAIGFQTEQCTLRGCAGWERGSWGYHSDDGQVYTFSEPLYSYRKDDIRPTPYSQKDIIGVFVDLPRQRARFRKNNQWVADWFYGVVGQLYPTVSFYIQENDFTPRVKVNFGNGAK